MLLIASNALQWRWPQSFQMHSNTKLQLVLVQQKMPDKSAVPFWIDWTEWLYSGPIFKIDLKTSGIGSGWFDEIFSAASGEGGGCSYATFAGLKYILCSVFPSLLGLSNLRCDLGGALTSPTKFQMQGFAGVALPLLLLYLRCDFDEFQMLSLGGVAYPLLPPLLLLLPPWVSPQKLGAGTGSGSCRAFPYRVENVSCRSLLHWLGGNMYAGFKAQSQKVWRTERRTRSLEPLFCILRL